MTGRTEQPAAPNEHVKLARSFWVLLAVGVAIRCVALGQPLLDAHLLRQCQTAAATKSLMSEPGLHLSARIPWVGDIDARYVQEFPLFNYLALALRTVVRDVDLSGKLVSILLWAVGFVCLQFIWRRMLRPNEFVWANLLFVCAPLGVFFGQAFMPEMLIQFLALAFLLSILRYRENPSFLRWTVCASAGLLALLVKFPETAHLYLILAIVLVRGEGWRAIIRPRYLIAAAGTLVVLKLWGSFMDTVNQAYLPEWASSANLRGFIGPLAIRFEMKRWLMVGLYLSAFVFAGPSLLGGAYGLSIFARERDRNLLGLWLAGLFVFYLVWFGNGPAVQSYYNLPALGPACALFGIGMAGLLKTSRRTWAVAWAFVVFLPAAPLSYYLFRQDRQLLAAVAWTRKNTQPNDVILFHPAHRWDLVDYPYDAILAYSADRRTFVWTKSLAGPLRESAWQRSRYVVMTRPHPDQLSPPTLRFLSRLRGRPIAAEPTDWLERNGYELRTNESDFCVYERAVP